MLQHGAVAAEVHVTLSKEAFGPDVTASLTLEQLGDLVAGSQWIHTAISNPVDKDGIVTVLGVDAAFEEDVESWNDAASLSSSWSHIVLQDSQGALSAFGANERAQCDVASWEDIVTFVARANFTVGVKTDGSVVTTVEGSSLDWHVLLWN